MEVEQQKYRLYVTTSLLYYEKQKIEEIFNTYSTRLDTINNSMEILLKDINNLKNIQDVTDEKEQLFKLLN